MKRRKKKVQKRAEDLFAVASVLGFSTVMIVCGACFGWMYCIWTLSS